VESNLNAKVNFMSHIAKLTSCFMCFLFVSPVASAFGQDGKKSDEKKDDIVREIVVSPRSGDAAVEGEVQQVEDVPEQYHVKNIAAPEPVPALKYRLYPSRGAMTPGNSVPFYYRTVVWLKDRTAEQKQELYDFMDKIGDLPFSEYDPEIQKQADRFSFAAAVQQLETAAYREQTNWDWQMNQLEGMEPISFLLPEIQESREISRILFVRSRVEAARGNFEEALRLNLLNLKLARDVAEPPTLINDLVGVAISSLSMATLRDMVCQTDCPNLYWALAALPDPLISLNDAMEYEASLPEIMFPFLKAPETAVRSADEWARLMRETTGAASELDSGFGDSASIRDLTGAGMLVRSYPVAKRELIAASWNRDQIEAMPVGQVVAIYQKRVTRTLYDETTKWSYLTYQETQRSARLKEEQERFSRERQRMREPFPLAQLLLPSILQAKASEARLQSKIKGLMVLEAIRMQTSANNGRLPKSLDEITIVPVPDECPLTGEPYGYRLTDEGAALLLPAMQESFGRKYWWEFHLKSK
jgi:hypothetical protein